MGDDDPDSTKRAVAMAMRDALDQARWSPDDNPSAVLSVLKHMIRRIFDLVTEDNALVVFSTDQLGETYGFAAAVNKTVDKQHSAQLPAQQAMSNAEFLDHIRQQFPQFHRCQHELLQALDRAFPPYSADSSS